MSEGVGRVSNLLTEIVKYTFLQRNLNGYLDRIKINHSFTKYGLELVSKRTFNISSLFSGVNKLRFLY